MVDEHGKGPRIITVREAVITISTEKSPRSDLTGEALIAVMEGSPTPEIDIEPRRMAMHVRDVVL